MARLRKLQNGWKFSAQTHHVHSTLKPGENDVSTWNTPGVFVGLLWSETYPVLYETMKNVNKVWFSETLYSPWYPLETSAPNWRLVTWPSLHMLVKIFQTLDFKIPFQISYIQNFCNTELWWHRDESGVRNYTKEIWWRKKILTVMLWGQFKIFKFPSLPNM